MILLGDHTWKQKRVQLSGKEARRRREKLSLARLTNPSVHLFIPLSSSSKICLEKKKILLEEVLRLACGAAFRRWTHEDSSAGDEVLLAFEQATCDARNQRESSSFEEEKGIVGGLNNTDEGWDCLTRSRVGHDGEEGEVS